MDRPLVRHAHPHCHVLIKVEGGDTQFVVGDNMVALTDQQAVLINAWEPQAYVHQQASPRTVILALYIEPQWLKSFRPNWAASGTWMSDQLTKVGFGSLAATLKNPP
jgi:AraC family transcriptional regulator